MCPSYMVTRDEKHTTRGRAHLLFEMLQGDAIGDGWPSEEVKESLDLYLACKGCKSDCPVNVDMATYKAEFLSHYYERHWRPRSAYSMGWISLGWRRWSRESSMRPAARRSSKISSSGWPELPLNLKFGLPLIRPEQPDAAPRRGRRADAGVL